MTGETDAGGAVSVFVDKSFGKLIMVGVKDRVPENKKRQYTMSSIPLTIEEARIMAKWLTGAADAAETLE